MQDERKTLDERNKMSDLERLRHSCAHVLATAILRLWPDAQFAYGPPVENGFYYDVLLDHRITPEDFPAIEAEMKKETKANNVFQKIVVTREQAIKDAQSGRLGALSERGTVSTFKLDLLNSIPEGEAISYYQNGDFIDLCAGPHVMRTGNIGAFKLTNVASAYYKGDEKNPQLQRIYGTAFKNKTEMEAYFTMIEEAKKRDHRKIGQEMGLFAMDADFTGPGLPLWLPKGTAIVEELEKLAKETEFAAGYVRVKTPHLAREKMYKTSGHLPYYADSMFPPMELSEAPKTQDNLYDLATKKHNASVELLRPTLEFANRELQRNFAPEVWKWLDHHLKDAMENAFLLGLDDEPFWPSHVEEYDELLNTLRSGAGEPSNPDSPWTPKFAGQLEQIRETASNLKSSLPANLKEQFLQAKSLSIDADVLLKKAKTASEPDRYYLKAMNCPHHHRVFAAEPKSYRDLPLRLAEYGTCYRFEQSGELFGLMRVRSMNMNDAHIYCTEDQFADEFRAVNDMYLKYFKIFGLEKYQMRFSTHDPKRLGEKFVNEPELWKKTEDMVRKVLIESGINYVEVANEAAFYGPKIDVQVWSAIGREFTIATNQVDFAVPARFGLTYKDRDNSNKTPLCIHRAPLGTHERFIGFLIEHYAGNFPLWMAPDQVRVITIGDDDKLVGHAKAIVNELRGKMVRVDGDFGAEPIKAKIQNAEQSRVHTMLVLGTRELENDSVAVRLHGKGNVGTKPTSEAIADIVASITERRANPVHTVAPSQKA